MHSEQLLKSRIFRVERLSYETRSGAAMIRDVVRHPGSVVIVPRLDDGGICLIKNFRVSVNQTLIELPAGTLEPPEPPTECAHRELIEETGYRAAEMRKIGSFFPAPGILDEEMHLFLATGLTAGEHARELGEEIENHVVSLEAARAMIGDGTIKDAKTIIGLLLIEDAAVRSR